MNDALLWSTFAANVSPLGKPRMTAADKWKRRPCVMRYREYCDAMRASMRGHAAMPAGADVMELRVVAHVAMPATWSQRKKKMMNGNHHRTKPDADNILKGVADALFADDAGIVAMSIEKFWAFEGSVIVSVGYARQAV